MQRWLRCNSLASSQNNMLRVKVYLIWSQHLINFMAHLPSRVLKMLCDPAPNTDTTPFTCGGISWSTNGHILWHIFSKWPGEMCRYDWTWMHNNHATRARYSKVVRHTTQRWRHKLTPPWPFIELLESGTCISALWLQQNLGLWNFFKINPQKRLLLIAANKK